MWKSTRQSTVEANTACHHKSKPQHAVSNSHHRLWKIALVEEDIH